MSNRLLSGRCGPACIAALVAVAGFASSSGAQTWTRLTNNAPGAVNLMLLLSDGSVMAAQSGDRGWYRYAPNHGDYQNGFWQTLAPMINTRLYYPSQVLRDGRVFVAGGEYGSGGPFAEIYNPVANTWTDITPPPVLWNTASNTFYDCNSEMLTDGSVLLMPVAPHAGGVGLRYNPAINIWSNAGPLFRGGYQDEASWVKLPDNSILTIDPFGVNSERYIPATNRWINDANVPVSLYDPFGSELGAALLLPNGKAFFLGSTGHTAIYTPSGDLRPGSWIAGADIPDGQGTPDAPAAMLVNGKILCAVSPVPTDANHFPAPTRFYEYDYLTNTFANVPGPTGDSLGVSSYVTAMLTLPNGTVLLSTMNNGVYMYHPVGAPLAAGKPVVQSVSANGDGSFHVSGLRFNGISEGASYGDDLQMNSNYPIVRLTNALNGLVYYARTYNWSSTGVQTGNLVVTTEVSIPANVPVGTYSMVVVANGIASDPFCLKAPTVGTAPVSDSACTSGSASFSVTAAGVGPFTYQWRRGATPLINGGKIAGAGSPTLVISQPDVSDAATDYNCVVGNGCGSVTTVNVTLHVCLADFNCDGAVDFFDYDEFVGAFESGTVGGDFNLDGAIDFFDYDEFVVAFEGGC